MRSVGLKVLKNKLSEYVRLAAAGETVLVTDRERVVAEIGPPRGRRNLPDDELMARGVREGWLTPPRRGSRTASWGQARYEPGAAHRGARPGPRRPVIYLDTSVAIAAPSGRAAAASREPLGTVHRFQPPPGIRGLDR